YTSNLSPACPGALGVLLFAFQAANIWLLVSRFNQPARHFYLAHGFAELCCIEDLLLAGEDEVLMRKRLPPRQN
ncbi:MAG: hypothetical protein H7842_15210, partial [Gammaproteobacteria bacterium SHHR-1]